ncbi:SDR family NAD(P)-dependent oxidoreductase [Micromonospora terminaliae]|uniref:SDR family NAD(P)-dependent oxidoreductase n=1 Tax=Micromonospora terminaliae TaxID=1914461 RepID=A0AAJ3DKV2_9ACTN|nr:type I polyketide synthase [Micromonospora terminaliae]NES30242.1 SDR family NAD(P)-dependent oxidoreductase [Micromonospora terminaliae]QGL46993.1 SDR family NAD(P)-dependent oxidoreductase [Micromonospora terminaliae]
MTRIAIVGMACRYPDANSPRELWENAVAGRRAFRQLPSERMNLDDYWSPDPAAPDRFYARMAAVIEGYEFDRLAFKVAGSTYRSTDLTHWLALDVAAQALADAGFPGGVGLPRQRTAAIVGNSLTGEFSRASQMRLRWPFVRRTVAAALQREGWDDDRLGAFLAKLEGVYKAPFAEVDEDTLAGGLSNTIAGRICNHFDLNGGGFTVDGACSSSLLAVATACNNLVDGVIDVAVAGGVDLSIDPFELIGFAKTGALARTEMKVYDRGANGFWPGEGCGMVVLMREEDALRSSQRVIATVAGWGMSSDGKGGMTRPEFSGYQLAMQRAYERAGFGVETVSLFEGHGTGTAVGDATELRALSEARRAAGATGTAVVGSVKAMIGHTKAAAGVAGLIKAAMAVHHQVLPPALGCSEPHDLLTAPDATLRVLRQAEPWPATGPVRAGVTAMGFGGINTHVVLENTRRRNGFDVRTRAIATAIQDHELLLVDAASSAELSDRLRELVDFVPTISYAQLGDLAASLHQRLRDLPYRAAVVASSPGDAADRLRTLLEKVESGETTSFSADGRSLLGHFAKRGQIGFLFPGQGSGQGTSGGAMRRRFTEADAVYAKAALPTGGDTVATEVAQPRIVTGSVAGLRVLASLGVHATVAVGHSLGELSALHWAGAMDEDALLRLAAQRGQAMSEHGATGTMARIGAPAVEVDQIIAGSDVVIAAYNSPQQTVIAGRVEAVEAACVRAREAGYDAGRLAVSHAFHSPLVAKAAEVFGAALDDQAWAPLTGRVMSSVTGELLPADADLTGLLRNQITDPVLFQQAIALVGKEVDLLIEVGPGRVLTGLAGAADLRVVALDTDDESLTGVLRAVGAAFVVGAAEVDSSLFHGRLLKPLEVGTRQSFFANPCEAAPALDIDVPAQPAGPAPSIQAPADPPAIVADDAGASSLELLRRLAADRAELPLDLVRPDSRLLDDLHLSSITVGQIVNQVATQLGIPAGQTPPNFATSTVRELADAYEALARNAGTVEAAAPVAPTGAASWVRPWSVDLDVTPIPPRAARDTDGEWQVFASPGHPYAQDLSAALARAGVGAGVLVCLPPDCTEQDLELALRGAKVVLAGPSNRRFVLVQHGRGAAGLAKTLHLESPQTRVTVVHLPDADQAVARVTAETAVTESFTEVFYDADGTRRTPTLRVLPFEPARTVPALAARDVLLVTGGGKGITAECALAMAQDSGAKLALLGRSDPAQDAELSANLQRMAQAGITVEYARADVTAAESVSRAVAALTATLGPVTAVLHGAGRNEPASLVTLETEAIARTLAPKTGGLRAVLAAVDPQQVRLLVTLGSIIGRAGLPGEAHYATANEWLDDATSEFGRRNPHCRTICLEWSVWSGVGMGERLDVVEKLDRDGVSAIPPEQGIAVLRRLLADPDSPNTVVISGRTHGIDTMRYDEPELPLLRFVDRPLVRYHGVELICEVELSAGTDLYLADHLLDGNQLFPAVFGMEAMAQVGAAVTGAANAPVVDNAEFLRPIVVPPHGSTRIRIAAVVTGPDTVEVALRSEETGFNADHFRARLCFAPTRPAAGAPEQVEPGLPAVPLDPMTDLYGPVLFQGRRFQRLRTYHLAAARDVDASVAADASTDWFASYLPSTLLLGDPGVRDAMMHGNQVCVPDATLLPQGIERIVPAGAAMFDADSLRFRAIERSRDGDTYVYDIALRDATGTVVERWEGLRLRAVRKQDGSGPWHPVLLGCYLERAMQDVLGSAVTVAVEPAPAGPDQSTTTIAIGRALGAPTRVRYTKDGQPRVAGGRNVSASSAAGLALCVAAADSIGCAVVPVARRTAQEWADRLGSHGELARLVARAAGDSLDDAATRVQAALECLSDAREWRLVTTEPVGWVVLGCGDRRVATLVTRVSGAQNKVAVAILDGGRE